MFEKIKVLISGLDTRSISENRKQTLQPLIDFIQNKASNNAAIRLNFICTHNSRRSHLSQVWAQTMAFYFKVERVFCYSGGTEATVLFPTVAATLESQGFKIEMLSQDENPVYGIKYAENEMPVIGFSKKFDSAFNPTSAFAAVMTCSQADQGCPFIAGAERRIPITFEDPKTYDGTPLENEKYLERSLQIANELYYVFSQINA